MLETSEALMVRDDIFTTVNDLFGITIHDYAQIEQGYLNRKWKLTTDIGSLFVKQYNKTRYPEQSVHGLEVSLAHQARLHQQGVPVPELFAHQGRHVLRTPSQERFVLMRMCEGHIIKPGMASTDQMHSLGQAVGKMHHLLNSKGVPQPLHWDIRSKEELYLLWEQRWLHANAMQCGRTIAALEVQRIILEDTDTGIFAECERGWGHWDLFTDNLLFRPGSVGAILDFDRLNYVYPEFDISRPILSCALDGRQLRIGQVQTFVQGYRERMPLTAEKLVRSIQLTWWKEAEWVAVEREHDSIPLKRFREENIWVADHWDHLRDMLAGI
ncbi:phosphotransferase [Paenibacillus kobensis]|uniref:phosphotransferase n=1 Tax=Paenibacillus kobensis TaxID=59841 RepID=UPI0013E35A19|nr:phosphotransferase [Paenibacillus kobensis]